LNQSIPKQQHLYPKKTETMLSIIINNTFNWYVKLQSKASYQKQAKRTSFINIVN